MKEVKKLYNPDTDAGRAKNDALSEKIENIRSVLRAGCCALILEYPGQQSFFFYFLNETKEHPKPFERTFEIQELGTYVVAAIILA
jgi:hypothetical protein